MTAGNSNFRPTRRLNQRRHGRHSQELERRIRAAWNAKKRKHQRAAMRKAPA